MIPGTHFIYIEARALARFIVSCSVDIQTVLVNHTLKRRERRAPSALFRMPPVAVFGSAFSRPCVSVVRFKSYCS